jgi:porin
MRKNHSICIGICTVGLAVSRWAGATPPGAVTPQAPEEQTSGTPAPEASLGFFSDIQRRQYLLGDMGGVRPLLSKYGMNFTLTETSEVLGNTTGGERQGFEYDGLTIATLQLDTQRAFGLHGGTFDVSALQIHGRNLSADNLLSLNTASGIESDRATRLWELWYQQKFLDEDRLDIKIGQQSLDQEFMVSQNALLFVNTMFGWPLVPSDDMPGGGPAYPLSAPGIRLRFRPTDSITLLGGVFSGSPSSKSYGDPQIENSSGTAFPLSNNLLAIAEIQYAYPALGAMVDPDAVEPLARTLRLGAWYDGQRFADERFGTDGLSLADPASNGDPRMHRGDFAIYGVADQMIYRDSDDADRTISAFVRAMGTSQSDRNLIDFSLNTGLVMHDPWFHRDDDSVGIGICYGRVSDRAAQLDRDTANSSLNGFNPMQSDETVIEATYQYSVTPWWQIQPDIQYVFNPGGGIANPKDPDERVHNELVFGVRMNILF